MKWGLWFESADRHVAQDSVGEARVSTVFLGLDHSFSFGGEPLLFETMVFGGPHDGHCDRTPTWGAAEEAHARALALVQNDG